jgi:hypothetical protein
MKKASTELLEQGTQTPSPAPDLIPAETKNQPRTHIGIGTVNGGTSAALRETVRGLDPTFDDVFRNRKADLSSVEFRRQSDEIFGALIQLLKNGAVC